jgi:hypothetical protein
MLPSLTASSLSPDKYDKLWAIYAPNKPLSRHSSCGVTRHLGRVGISDAGACWTAVSGTESSVKPNRWWVRTRMPPLND